MPFPTSEAALTFLDRSTECPTASRTAEEHYKVLDRRELACFSPFPLGSSLSLLFASLSTLLTLLSSQHAPPAHVLLHHLGKPPPPHGFGRFGDFHSSSSSLICPSPFTGRPTDAFSSSSTFSHHQQLNTTSSAFHLSLSHSTSHCNVFRLRISRLDKSTCSAAVPELNEDDATTEYVKGRLGPDTFQVQVDGAERLVLDEPARFDGEKCEYEYEVALVNAGAVWLQVTHFYEVGVAVLSTSSRTRLTFFLVEQDYNSYISTSNHQIPRLIIPMLSTPVQLSLCGTSCAPYTPPLLGHPSSLIVAETPSVPSSHHHPSFFSSIPVRSLSAKADDRLPACTGPRPIPGSYIPSALPSLLYPPFQLPMTVSRPSSGYHTFVPTACEFKHDGLRFRDHASCLRTKHNALFLGDSHARGMYDVMAHRLKGNKDQCKESFKVANKAEDIGDLHLVRSFLPLLLSPPPSPVHLADSWRVRNPTGIPMVRPLLLPLHSLLMLTSFSLRRSQYLDIDIDCTAILPFDSITISTGSHQACYRCPPNSAFISHLSHVFSSWPSKIRQCRQQALTSALLRAEEGAASTADLELSRRLEKDVTLVYVTSPAWYPQAKEKTDCRTAQRMDRWNEMAMQLALDEGWSVVNAGALSKPMVQVRLSLPRTRLSTRLTSLFRVQDTRLMDGVHYIKTDAIDPMVDELVEKLGFCGNESVDQFEQA